jgi:ankyrin repeat protein
LLSDQWSILDIEDQMNRLKYLDWNIPQMIDAIKNHDHNTMLFIISRGFDVVSNSELLSYAIKTQDLTSVQILIDNCANINAVLDYACQQNNYSIVKLLIDSNADITLDNYKALVSAVKIGSIALVKLFLNAGLDIGKCLDPLMKIKQPMNMEMENWLVDLYC